MEAEYILKEGGWVGGWVGGRKPTAFSPQTKKT